MRILLFTTALLLPAGVAFGGPCLPGSLNDYLNLSAGCTVNSVTFQDFFLGVLAGFSTAEIDPDSIQVTPGSVSNPLLLFTLNSNAGPGAVFESVFHFSATGPPMMGASIRLGNPMAAGDGAVTGILDVCVDGFFLGAEPLGCDGTPQTAIAFATSLDTEAFAPVSFGAPASFLDVFVDLTVDGGLSGSARLDSAEVGIAAIPEPSAALLMMSGLVTLALAVKRRKRHSL